MNIETLKEALKLLREEDELKIVDANIPDVSYHIVEGIFTHDDRKCKRCLTLSVERTMEYKHD